jgi:methionyl-tRNA synthetase
VGRFYVTTPIYYVNDVPHVGHAYTTVNADALARWHRLMGDEVWFLTGTDEHGLKVAQSAEANGVSPDDWTDQTSERFRAAWRELRITNDDFIRTTEARHHHAVQKFLGAIWDSGHIELGTYEGPYCVSCETYYTEAELIEGKCPVHRRDVELVKEDNYFFKLSRFEQPLLEWYAANPGAVGPEAKRNEAVGFIRQGLKDISITRTSLSWGVPVPWDERHVFYVWYDALVNYITSIGYGDDPERFEGWWPYVHHLIGKEIIRFHCVWWPAMCIAAGVDPPAHVFVHGWLLVGGEKMSKTALNQISPGELVADFGVDAVRYQLLRDTALGSDGDFSYEGTVARYNSDLANNLGNLLSRVATVIDGKCGGVGPAPDHRSRLAGVASEVFDAASRSWSRLAPHEALEHTWKLIRETNAELEAAEPWKAEPGPGVDAVLGSALEALRIVALLVSPALPGATQEIWSRIGLPGAPEDQRLPEAAAWGGYPGGVPVKRGEPLFPRIKT